MKNRHQSRVLVVQALYAHTIKQRSNIKMLLSDMFDWLSPAEKEKYSGLTLDYAILLFQGVIEKKTELDAIIKKHLKGWTFSRLSVIDISILRLGVYSLYYLKETPPNVVINESVILSKEFSGSHSYGFINGILDSINKQSLTDEVKQ
ncbi:MAG: transcription antitermination factor NusB [Spirochaetia bacterium]|nr:transcription antitermination factor NusB [Spirochaetia bacterium]MCF7946352.1 transcription antitermination factor NusB [Spirochaetia bacterium]